jgi:hypothetical protein
VTQLLSGLTTDMAVWNALSTRFQADVFCGLFLQEGNQGLSLSPSTLIALGRRGLPLALDVYAPGEG